MYCGQLIEDAPIEQLYEAPQHPYTQGLLRSIPRIRAHKLEKLPVIEGTVPDLLDLPPGCRFADRCPRATQLCIDRHPPLVTEQDRRIACFHPGAQVDHG
jgi:oligopeptide/dipeptide ABC transporter ATP-binding protein